MDEAVEEPLYDYSSCYLITDNDEAPDVEIPIFPSPYTFNFDAPEIFPSAETLHLTATVAAPDISQTNLSASTIFLPDDTFEAPETFKL